MLFFDTSALVKAYLHEPGTSTVRAVLDRFSQRIVLSEFVALEVLTTFAKRLRSTKIGKAAYNTARTEFSGDFPAKFELVEVEEAIIRLAVSLTHQHRQHSVGAMDLLHVATALHAQSTLGARTVVIASSDAGLLSLAKACGLGTFDPETQPLASLLSLLN